ncbi:unnamed protein product [Symbiodinium sp. CCMP2592]|nr:unnamed protein product [Symbiodinium sp. CCMP2592]
MAKQCEPGLAVPKQQTGTRRSRPVLREIQVRGSGQDEDFEDLAKERGGNRGGRGLEPEEDHFLDYQSRWKRWAADIEFRLAVFESPERGRGKRERAKGGVGEVLELELEDPDHVDWPKAKACGICVPSELTETARPALKERSIARWSFERKAPPGLGSFGLAERQHAAQALALHRLEHALSLATSLKRSSPRHDLHSRGQQWLEEKRAKEHQLREQHRDLELRECTFQPQTGQTETGQTETGRQTGLAPSRRTRSTGAVPLQSARSVYDRQLRWQTAVKEKKDQERQRRDEAAEEGLRTELELAKRRRSQPQDVEHAFACFHERNRKWQSMRQARQAQQQQQKLERLLALAQRRREEQRKEAGAVAGACRGDDGCIRRFAHRENEQLELEALEVNTDDQAKIRDVMELYEDRKIAQVSTASEMINW